MRLLLFGVFYEQRITPNVSFDSTADNYPRPETIVKNHPIRPEARLLPPARLFRSVGYGDQSVYLQSYFYSKNLSHHHLNHLPDR